MDEKKSGSHKREFLVTFADFAATCRRSQKWIVASALIGAIAATTYTLSQPLKYEVKATYKEKGRVRNREGGMSLASMLGGSSIDQSEVCTLMASRTLTEELVRIHTLNAIVAPKIVEGGRLRRIRDNLKVEYAYWRQHPKPHVPDSAKPVTAAAITYDDELPQCYEFSCVDDSTYDLYSDEGQLLGRYYFGDSVTTTTAHFTLLRDSSYPLPVERQLLTLYPVNQVATSLVDKIDISSDPRDKTLLTLSYQHHDRHLAAALLNTLMTTYHRYLEDEQKRITNEQVLYLERRQEESNQQLAKTLEKYANLQIEDLTSDGFLNVDSAMTFLTQNQQAHKKKLLGLDLEMQRLNNVRTSGYAYYDRTVSDGDPAIINTLLEQMRALRQKGDTIQMALESDTRFAEDENAFDTQIEQLDIIQTTLTELRSIATSLRHGHLIAPSGRLLTTPHTTLQSWYEIASHSKQAIETAIGPYSRMQRDKEWQARKEQYLAYLNHLIHNYEVREKTFKERLTHQTTTSQEFAGLDLTLANTLFLSYHQQLHDLEAQRLQNRFVIENLQDEEFEVSAMSSFVHDPITNEIVVKYSHTLLALKDEANRSSKEQERIRNDLLRHRGFLEMHLSQAADLIDLRITLLHDKMFALQNFMLDLIQQQVSLLEQQLDDYLVTRLNDIEQERRVIHNQLTSINSEIARLPKRWIAEQFVTQQMEMGQRMGKEIAHLVESKNINNNLEVIQSAPVDIAIAPLYPRRPYPLFYALLGAGAGAFLCVGGLLGSNALRGLRATEANLTELGEHVSGTFSPEYGSGHHLHDDDLALLRRLQAHLTPQKSRNTTLLITGRGPDYSSDLARLAALRGLKVLLLPTTFDVGAPRENGLLAYLTGSVDTPHIDRHINGYSTIAAGGCSRYGSELINSERFHTLLDDFSSSYDWVIAVATTTATSAEVQSQLPLFANVTVTIQDETLEELRPYFHLTDTGTHTVSYLLFEEKL